MINRGRKMEFVLAVLFAIIASVLLIIAEAFKPIR